MNVFMPRSCAFSYKDRGTSLILGILCDKIINEFAGMWIPGLEHPQRRCGNASKYKRIAVRCTVIPPRTWKCRGAACVYNTGNRKTCGVVCCDCSNTPAALIWRLFLFIWGNIMVKKATRAKLFNTAERICGRIFAIEIKYGPLVQAEIARRDKKIHEMGFNGPHFV